MALCHWWGHGSQPSQMLTTQIFVSEPGWKLSLGPRKLQQVFVPAQQVAHNETGDLVPALDAPH
jgi:hypothetical protein